MATARARRNSSTCRYFACRDGFTRPCPSEIPSAFSTGWSSGSRRCLVWSCVRCGVTGSARSLVCSSGSPFLVTRSWWVCVVVSTCQLANCSASSSSSAAATSCRFVTCAWVSSYAVSWRWRPALRSTYRSSTRRHLGCGCPRRRPDARARTRCSSSSTASRSCANAVWRSSAIDSHALLGQRSDHDDQDEPAQRNGDDESSVARVHVAESSVAATKVCRLRASSNACDGTSGAPRERERSERSCGVVAWRRREGGPAARRPKATQPACVVGGA